MYRLPVWGQYTVNPEQQERLERIFDRAVARKPKYTLDLEHVQMTLVPEGPASRIVLDPPAEAVFAEGVMVRQSVRVFTDTTKMRCLSFSLRSGPRSAGGTCSVADADSVPGKLLVCKECYSFTESNYQRAANQIAFRVRLEWVMRCLRRRGEFADRIVEAIGPMPNFRYFRIHDSGDFMGNARYVQEWVDVAHRLSHISFWAPTREWTRFDDLDPEHKAIALAHGIADVSKGLSEAFKSAPPNMIVRPSALNVNDPPPRIAGLAAGTSVIDTNAQMENEPCGYGSRSAYCMCAAIATGGSCETARCRICWDQPEREVGYPEH